MRFRTATVIGFLFLMFVSPSHALTLNVLGYDPDSLITVNYWLDGVKNSASVAQLNVLLGEDVDETYGYSVDVGPQISSGVYPDYLIDPLSPKYLDAAWLLEKYAASANTKQEQADLQLAIWATVYGEALDIKKRNVYLDALAGRDTLDPSLDSKYSILSSNGGQNLIIAYSATEQAFLTPEGLPPDPPAPVPEPTTGVLFGSGLVALGWYFWRKKRQA